MGREGLGRTGVRRRGWRWSEALLDRRGSVLTERGWERIGVGRGPHPSAWGLPRWDISV